MKVLGIILAFFNVLFAAILLVLAGQNYTKNREARYEVFRHQIMEHGLPVDEKEIFYNEPDEPIFEKLTPSVVTAIFADAPGDDRDTKVTGARGGADLGGAEVRTVMEELRRVKAKVRENVTNLGPNQQAQRNKIRDYLLTQAAEITERQAIRNRIATTPIETLQNELDARFDDVIGKYGQGGGGNWDAVRYAAAPLLINLNYGDEWRTRVRTIVGLPAYVQGLNTSAYTLGQIAATVRDGIIRDQGEFVAEYQEMILHLKYQSESLVAAAKQLAETTGVKKDRQVEVNDRKVEVQVHRTELAERMRLTNVEVQRLEVMQADLFAVEQKLGLALEETRKLEEQLRRRNPSPRP